MNEVDQAAIALLDPSTDPTTRRLASQFLEHWMATESAWQGAVEWLHRSCQPQATGLKIDESIRFSMTLLCLQLLQSKIRREVPLRSEPPPTSVVPTNSLVMALSQLLQSESNSSVLSSACIALTALTVRCGQLSELLRICSYSLAAAFNSAPRPEPNNNHFPPLVALKVLSNIPQELSACALTTPQVTGALSPNAPAVLDSLRQSLMSSASMGSAASVDDPARSLTILEASLEALYYWTKIGHLSISVWNVPNNTTAASSTEVPVLPVVAHLLSMVPTSEACLVWACRALTEAILVPTDACTEARSVACRLLWQSAGFLSVPLQVATCPSPANPDSIGTSVDGDNDEISECWEDACHALAILATTLVCEQVDDLVGDDDEENDATTPLVQRVLLTLQQHPLLKVRIIVLEVWLTIQDVPTAQRHEAWKKPLFGQLLTILLQTLSYPSDYPHFTNMSTHGSTLTGSVTVLAWKECMIDASEWNEYRRMVKDVLISTYFLMRSDYVEYCVHCLSNPTDQGWRLQEAAVFALSGCAREVCARIKSGVGFAATAAAHNNPVSAGSDGLPKGLLTTDRQRTSQALLHLLQILCDGTPEGMVTALALRHLHVLAGVVEFVGAYAPAWEALPCTPQTCLQLLALLNQCLDIPDVAVPAAKSARSILIGCSSKLLVADFPQVLDLLGQLFVKSATLPDDEVLNTILEGCTRLLVQFPDETRVRQGLVTLADPLLQTARSSLHVLMTERPIHYHPQQQPSPDTLVATTSLGRSLDGLQAIVRFCDRSDVSRGVSAGQLELVQASWSLLEEVSQNVDAWAVGPDGGADLQQSVLGLYERLLLLLLSSSSAGAADPQQPALATIHAERALHLAVVLLERPSTPQVCALTFLSRAAEVVGSMGAFRDSLPRAAAAVLRHASRSLGNGGSDDDALLAALWELFRRSLLHCPTALVDGQSHPVLPEAVAGAVRCLERSEEAGTEGTTRSALRFLSQLYQWSSQLPLPGTLNPNAGIVEGILRHWGGAVVRQSVAGLLDGPSGLAVPYADALWSVVSCPVASTSASASASTTTIDPTTGGGPSTMTSKSLPEVWLEVARVSASADPVVFQRVGLLLLQLAAASSVVVGDFSGQTVPPPSSQRQKQLQHQQHHRAKSLLSDWRQIHRGELSSEAVLDSYVYKLE